MNKKAQIISLDFLISLIAITLAIGLLIQFSEMKTYNEKEEVRWTELKLIAENASGLLISNPDIVCELVDESNNRLLYLNNCLTAIFLPPGTGLEDSEAVFLRDNRLGSKIFKEDIGIMSGYSCNISFSTIVPMSNSNIRIVSECEDNSGNAQNVYSITRKIVVFDHGKTGNIEGDSTLEKSQLEACTSNEAGCPLKEGTITLQVWKA